MRKYLTLVIGTLLVLGSVVYLAFTIGIVYGVIVLGLELITIGLSLGYGND